MNQSEGGWHWVRHKDASFSAPIEWRTPGFWVINGVPATPDEAKKFAADHTYEGQCITLRHAQEIAALNAIGWFTHAKNLMAAYVSTEVVSGTMTEMLTGKDVVKWAHVMACLERIIAFANDIPVPSLDGMEVIGEDELDAMHLANMGSAGNA